MAIVWIILSLCACVHLASGAAVNVARDKPTNASSQYGSFDTYGPFKAVDGDRNAVDPGGSVITTAEHQTYGAWWVDLQIQVQDPTVIIYFRKFYEFRRASVQVFTSNTSFSSFPPGDQPCYSTSANYLEVEDIVTITECTGRWQYLMVYRGENDYILDFGEVEVWGCDGTYGDSCSKSCNSRQCAVTPTSCDRYTGACPDGRCKAGWMGADCTACSTGRYGASCNKSCNSRQCAETSSSCDWITGACPNGQCKAGWMGTDCTEVCSAGRYGVNCNKSCSSRHCAVTPTSCDRYTGACPAGGCEAGWMGTDCTQFCSTGSYGANCGKSCNDRQCAVTSTTCDRTSGVCNPAGCTAGYRGTDCVDKCGPRTYGIGCKQSCTDRRCKNSSSSCDHVTGECVGGCKAGRDGTDCTQECTDGTYGFNCVKSCSDRHCKTSSSHCDRDTGQCQDGCERGWRGEDCTSKCPAGTFGTSCFSCNIRHCQGEVDCPGDGACSAGCEDGWTLNNCTLGCPDGTFGSNCSSNCGNCTDGDICNHVTGNCPADCNAGWQGKQCKRTCEGNKYGVNCGETCGHCAGTCDRTSGHCPDGCQEGYNGTKCQMKLETTDPIVIPAVAGTVAAVLVIVIIAITVIVWKSRTVSMQYPQGVHMQMLQTGYPHSGSVANPQMHFGRRSSQDNKLLDSQANRALKGIQAMKDINNGVGDVYVNVVNVDEKGAKSRAKPLIKPELNEKQAAQEKLKLETKPKSSLQHGEPNADPDLEEEIQDEEDFSPSSDYYNVDDTEEVIREIPVRDLEKTIQKIRNRKGGFEAEYNRLPSGFTAPYDESQKPENSGKNKFKGYYPYDHNRVHLSTVADTPGSDYINASIMHSYDQRKTYIAAQAPNKKTIGDFWRMIWEQHCGRVVMLTGLVEGGKAKCYQYWPDDGTLNTDQFRVEVEVTDTCANYTVRHLKVTSKNNGQRRSVVQYHYTSWPDHGVPDTLALVHFIWMIRKIQTQTDRPLLVHCSAGIGRTGTYIAVDSLLDQARREGMVDIQGYVSVMRGQRKNMIQTKEQYECVFHCLVEMTKFGNTSMDVENFTTSYSNRGMDSVVDQKTIREITQMVVKEVRSDSPARHRMWVNGNEDFIVRVGPTLRQLRGYLQAVPPPPGLEKLLWKLVEENNAHNVIVMSQKNMVGEKGSVKKYGDMVVTTMNQNNLSSDLTMTTVQLQMEGEGISRSIKLYDFKGASSLDSMSPLLLNNTHLHHLSTEITPVVIIHSESDRKCVVAFCIMGNILSGILEDHYVDVIGHVRTFLKCCPDVIFTEGDIEKLYQFALRCVEMTGAANTYANL